jgi:hypothetical protein
VPLTPQTLALAGAVCSAAATILIRQGLPHSNFYAGFWINVVVGVVGLWGIIVLTEPAEGSRLSISLRLMLWRRRHHSQARPESMRTFIRRCRQHFYRADRLHYIPPAFRQSKSHNLERTRRLAFRGGGNR